MKVDGFEEVKLRLQLGVGGECIARLLESVTIGSPEGDVASQLRQDVLPGWLADEVWPGVANAVSALVEACEIGREQEVLFDVVPLVESWLKTLPPDPPDLPEQRLVMASKQALQHRQAPDTAGDSPALAPIATARGAGWVAAATALGKWRVVRAKVEKWISLQTSRNGWLMYADWCQDLRKQVADGSMDLLRAKMDGHLPQIDEGLLNRVEEILHLCGKQFDHLALHATEDNENEATFTALGRLVESVDKVLTAHASWPASELVMLADRLAALDSERLGSVVEDLAGTLPNQSWDLWAAGLAQTGIATTPEATARAILLRAVIDVVAIAPTPTALGEVTQFSEKLLAQMQLSAAILTDPDDERAKDLKQCEGNRWVPRHLTMPALVLIEGNRVIPFTDAEVMRPVAVPPEVTALFTLAAWCRTPEAGQVHLAEMCSQLANEWAEACGIANWQIAPSEAWDRMVRLWVVVQHAAVLLRINPASGDAVGLLLHALASHNIRPGHWAATRSIDLTEIETRGPWFLARRGCGDHPTVFGHAPAVEIGDHVFGMTIWLFNEADDVDSRPLLQTLERATPYLALAWSRDPSWVGWTQVNASTWQSLRQTVAAADRARASEFILLFYRRGAELDRAGNADLARYYFVLGFEMHATLTRDLQTNISLRIDPLTYRARPLDGPTPGITVRWQPGAEPMGTVLDLLDVKANGQVVANVSCGPALPSSIAAWYELPAAEGLPPLQAWQDELVELVWFPQDIPARIEAARADFAAWLDAPPGQDGFHCLLEKAADSFHGLETDALRWLRALRNADWCRSFPDLDLETRKVRWPRDVSPIGLEGIQLEFSSTAEVGCVLPGDIRFASQPGRARCTISLGERIAGSGLDTAVRIQELASRAPAWFSETVGPPARLLVADEKSAQFAPMETQQHAAVLLDSLVAAADLASLIDQPPEAKANHMRLSPEAANLLDEALAAIRAWTHVQGIAIIPGEWSFRQPVTYRELPTKGCETRIVFRDQINCGQVFRVISFGLEGSTATERPAVVQVSAGKEPSHFSDLIDLLREEYPGGEGWVRQMRDWLRDWPRAGLTGRLEYAATKLFESLWSPAVTELRDQFAPAFGEILGFLTTMLALEFRLFVFTPAVVGQFPSSWVEVIASNGVRTGRVTRVLRPGLRDEANLLRLQAIVEAE